MRNKDFGRLMEKRTKQFAVEIIKLSSLLSNSEHERIIRNQIIRSGTSIGANYREANFSRSKADFKNKLGICVGETNETLYWLELIMEFRGENKAIIMLYSEAKEFLAIFTSAINKLSTSNT